MLPRSTNLNSSLLKLPARRRADSLGPTLTIRGSLSLFELGLAPALKAKISADRIINFYAARTAKAMGPRDVPAVTRSRAALSRAPNKLIRRLKTPLLAGSLAAVTPGFLLKR